MRIKFNSGLRIRNLYPINVPPSAGYYNNMANGNTIMYVHCFRRTIINSSETKPSE